MSTAKISAGLDNVAAGPPAHLSRVERLERFVSRLSTKNNFWHKVCSLIWLPYAFRSGISMRRLDSKRFTAVLPFKRVNRNWYNAMAGTALLGNSEVAAGMYLFSACGSDYTVVCKEMRYQFLRPCLGPAVYHIVNTEDVDEKLKIGGEFNIDLELEIRQQLPKKGTEPVWPMPHHVPLHAQVAPSQQDQANTGLEVSERRSSSALSIIGWGLFCTCSWTWCIGMFLPHYMLGRFGWPGLVIFAIPNVLGCAGFGYVLATRQRSERMVARHGPAMAAFSLIAIVFQMFFVSLLLGRLAPDHVAWPGLAAAAAVVGIGALLSRLRDRAWLVLAVLTYAISLVAFVGIGTAATENLRTIVPTEPAQLIGIGPIVIIGFLLCPYLDLTFHRALQRSPSRHAFAVFGVTFSVMLALTCFLWYAPSNVLGGFALAHLFAQMTFTVGAHAREMMASPVVAGRGLGRGRRRGRGLGLLALTVVGAALLPLAGMITDADTLAVDMYVRFLVFYGLVVPAYVLVFIGPGRPATLGRRNVLVVGAVVVALLPLLEAGFLQGYAPVLFVPLALAAGWLLVRGRVSRASRSTA